MGMHNLHGPNMACWIIWAHIWYFTYHFDLLDSFRTPCFFFGFTVPPWFHVRSLWQRCFKHKWPPRCDSYSSGMRHNVKCQQNLVVSSGMNASWYAVLKGAADRFVMNCFPGLKKILLLSGDWGHLLRPSTTRWALDKCSSWKASCRGTRFVARARGLPEWLPRGHPSTAVVADHSCYGQSWLNFMIGIYH